MKNKNEKKKKTKEDNIRSRRELMHLSRSSKNDNRNTSITKYTNFLSFFQDPISSLWVSYLPIAWVLYSLYLYLSSPHFLFSLCYFLPLDEYWSKYIRRRNEWEYLLRDWQAINFRKFQKRLVFKGIWQCQSICIFTCYLALS